MPIKAGAVCVPSLGILLRSTPPPPNISCSPPRPPHCTPTTSHTRYFPLLLSSGHGTPLTFHYYRCTCYHPRQYCTSRAYYCPTTVTFVPSTTSLPPPLKHSLSLPIAPPQHSQYLVLPSAIPHTSFTHPNLPTIRSTLPTHPQHNSPHPALPTPAALRTHYCLPYHTSLYLTILTNPS